VDAWLVDALTATGFTGSLETVFGRGLVVTGVAMFAGSVLGGVVAQATNLGVPFLLRAGVLLLMLLFAAVAMRDLGFTPDRSLGPVHATRHVLQESIEHGLRKPPVRWVILAAPFAGGVGIYAFYALQPYLLELYGDPTAYSIAGLAAAILSLAQVAGGLLASRVRRLFARRTTTIIGASIGSVVALVLLGLTSLFWLALVLLVVWGFVYAVSGPVRQAYLNDMIPSKQRATVLSFDSLFGSLGGVFIQPALGRSADLWGYGTSLVIGGVVELIGVPFLVASRRRRDPADTATVAGSAPGAAGAAAESAAGAPAADVSGPGPHPRERRRGRARRPSQP
jgi:MFS family permease